MTRHDRQPSRGDLRRHRPRGWLTGGLAEDALGAVKAALSGCERLIYKAVPIVYHQRPSLDDRYALWAAGASLVVTTCPARSTWRTRAGAVRAGPEG